MSAITNANQLAIIDKFVEDLEVSLDVSHEKVSFEKLWSTCPPKAAGNESLQDFMKDASNSKFRAPMYLSADLFLKVSRNSFFHDDYHSFDTFRDEYSKRYGTQPYVSPPVRWQWSVSIGF